MVTENPSIRRWGLIGALALLLLALPAHALAQPGPANAPQTDLLLHPDAACGEEPADPLLVLETGDHLILDTRISTKMDPVYSILVDGLNASQRYVLAYEDAQGQTLSIPYEATVLGNMVQDGQGQAGGAAVFEHVPIFDPPPAPYLPLGPLYSLRPYVDSLTRSVDGGDWVARVATTGEEIARLGVGFEATSETVTGTTEEECDPSTGDPWADTLLPSSPAPGDTPHGELTPGLVQPTYQYPETCEPGAWPSLELAEDRVQVQTRESYGGDFELITAVDVPYDFREESVDYNCNENVTSVQNAVHQGLSWASETELSSGALWWIMGVHGNGWEDEDAVLREIRIGRPSIYVHGDEFSALETYRPGISHGYGGCSDEAGWEKLEALAEWFIRRLTLPPWWILFSNAVDSFTEEDWEHALERHCTKQYHHPSWDPWTYQGCQALSIDEGTSCIQWHLYGTKPNVYSWEVRVSPNGQTDAVDVVYAWDAGAYYLDCWSKDPLYCEDWSRHFRLPAIRLEVPTPFQ